MNGRNRSVAYGSIYLWKKILVDLEDEGDYFVWVIVKTLAGTETEVFAYAADADHCAGISCTYSYRSVSFDASHLFKVKYRYPIY